MFHSFSPSQFMPHGHCYYWDSYLLWSHALSDGIIALAYCAIPLTLLYIYLKRKKDFQYVWMVVLFAVFIFGCGMTHVFDVITLWKPLYYADSAVRIITAAASIATALALIRITPQLLLAPSPEQWLSAQGTLEAQVAALQEKDYALREMNAQLSYRLEQLDDAQQLSQIGSFETDHDRQTFSGTRELGRIFGWSSEHNQKPMPVSLLYQSIHPEDKDWVGQKIAQAVKRRENYEFEHRLLLAGGILKHVLVRARLFTDEKGTLRSRGSVLDITGRKEQERQLHILNGDLLASNEELSTLSEELTASNEALQESYQHLQQLHEQQEALIRERTKSLEQALRELEERNQELDQYVYKVSHDIRSPVASILGLLQLMHMEELPVQISTYLTLIENRVSKLDEFIKSVLAHSRSLNTRVAIGPIDFDRIIDQCLEELHYYPGVDQIRILRQLPEPGAFRSDELRLQILFKNLLSNAIKYRNWQGESFLSIRIGLLESEAVMVVEDNGQGIPPAYLDKVFGMFVRASEKSDGSGLGLYIVKQTVERMGGVITLSSQLGKGTTFTVRLPYQSG